MRKLFDSKFTIVLFSLAGLVALALLSAALRDFAFRPSEPFSFELGQLPALSSGGNLIEIPLWKLILFSSLIICIFAVLIVLSDAETRKRVLMRLFRFAMLVLTLWMVMNYASRRQSEEQAQNPVVAPAPGAPGAFQNHIPAYVPPQISAWLVFAVSFGVALILMLIAWFVYSRRARARPPFSLDDLASITREALDGLQAGRNWDDAIIGCYVRMNEVALSERGLVRQPGHTPREFALRMERAGLPGEAARTLTRLFEQVRYGGQKSGALERDQAVAALNAILQACGVQA